MFWRRRRSDADFADEIASHLQLEADELQSDGLPQPDANAAARRAFGNLSGWKERFYEAQRILLIENLVRDLRYAWHGLRRSPSFSLVVALTLAIGIGANAAVIGVIDTAFLRKLPVAEPERIFGIFSNDVHMPSRRSVVGWNSFPDYIDLRAKLQGVDGLVGYSMQWLPLGDSLTGSAVWSAMVSGNYFSVLRVPAQRGRVIRPDEEEPRGAHPVVVISDAMWTARFARDEHVIGQQLAIGSGRFTIIGIAPPGFTGTHPEGRTDVWMPYTMYAEATGKPYIFDNRDTRMTAVLGRLATGITLAQVSASVERASHDLAAAYPDVDGLLRMRAGSREHLVSFEQSPSVLVTFLFVWAIIALLHLVACANVASLMLARAAARRQELGIRLCLGASRGRVIMQSLAEPALLAVIGATAGLLVARWLTSLITSMQFMSAMGSRLDIRVVGVVALVTVATVIEFGLVPALEASRRDPLTMIRGSSGSRVAGRRNAAASLLVVAQVAVSLVLLANAATLARTFERQANATNGFDSPHLLTASIALKGRSSPVGDLTAGIDELVRRTASLPGVSHVAVSSGAPLLPGGWYGEVIVAGHQYAEGESRSVSGQNIGPAYFATIGTAMARGREFTPRDRAVGATAAQGFDVTVVNETMARRFWPGEDPIGKQLAYRNKTAATVIGVVRDIRDVTPSQVVPRVYFPLLEMPVISRFQLVVRSRGEPESIRSSVRAAITSASQSIDSPQIQTIEELRNRALSVSRAASIGLGTCAAVALLLTVIGLYGLVASWSAERRSEIGIRLALGAQSWQVHRLLAGGVAQLIAVGAVIGLAGAIAMIRLERNLYGPSITFEAWPLLSAVLLLSAAAATAAYMPSRRATRIDPARSLRME